MSAPHGRFGKSIAAVELATQAVERGERVLIVGGDDARSLQLARMVRDAAGPDALGVVLAARPAEPPLQVTFDEPMLRLPPRAKKARPTKSLAYAKGRRP